MTTGTRRWLGTDDRYIRLRRIETLDLPTEYREIAQLFYADFQSTMLAKSINGFMMNNAAPRISRVLASTGELEHRIVKRIVDTTILASTVMIHGFTGEGRDAARRVNAMHRQYDIHPDDFLVVGAEEAVGSIELAERYGWRSVTAKEREALNLFYSHQTRAFGSPNPLPATYGETKALFEAYLDAQLRYEPQNERLGAALVKFVATLAPALVRPMLRFVLLAQLDPRVARACGIRVASKPARAVADAVLRAYGRRDPIPDGAPNHLAAMVKRVYPDGYEVGRLGTHLGSQSGTGEGAPTALAAAH